MSLGLFELARRSATAVGIDGLDGVPVGGASDGKPAAAAGRPTLDGLGAVGGGAHADDEHVDVSRWCRAPPSPRRSPGVCSTT